MFPLLKEFKGFLLDSGAFTFMTSLKGKSINWNEYVINYGNFVKQHDIKHFFELDIDPIVGLKDTPKRYIKFMKEFLEPKEFNFTCFDAEGADEMIFQTNIPFYSLCEHHIAPFFGVANVAYIPVDKIVGLSKLARTVDLYANRFQNQERITTQIAERLQKELNPIGVAVSLKAQHFCMCMRGVKKSDTWTITSKMLGAFKDDDKARNEFLNLIR